MTTDAASPQEDLKALAFLGRAVFPGGKHRGGILVTDPAGRPLEFRCTDAVRPTQVQELLYGAALIPHMALELFGVPLLSALERHLDVVLCDDDTNLCIRPRVQWPVISVQRHGKRIEVVEATEAGGATRGELLQTEPVRFDPVVIRSHPDYPEEQRQWRERLRPVFRQLDLLEPFERIHHAIAAIHSQQDEQGK